MAEDGYTEEFVVWWSALERDYRISPFAGETHDKVTISYPSGVKLSLPRERTFERIFILP